MQDYEKLGAFYLGKSYDTEADKQNEDLVLYDSKDLTTHAVIIGMTGSGKTGLGIGLLEEAAIDKVPVIAIDPKGDLGNCLLNFPKLQAADLEPWVNPQQAANQGMTVSQFAADQARMWEGGLNNWGQGKARIKRLRDSVDMAIYTPGSNAGIPVSVLKSFNAPPVELMDEDDLYRERVQSTATSILALLDIDSDPLTSREHILISNILRRQWDEGNNMDIPALIGAIQNPGFDKIGVMDLDSFFPAKDRFALSMRLNNLLAAPGFEVWMQGQDLDAGRLLYTESGQPRLSVMSIAHLSDSQRMFFVTMLLNELLSWMRKQPGTGSLRAILYMDEIFGYMPPLGNPPSKVLLLTLLKQARAFGVGLVLATQNPVDLDYKGLSNTGTWFIGRLQTERDKARVMEGLEGASGGGEFDRAAMERTLAGLGKRKFLLHNVHESQPVVFATRWVLSYLSGPLTRDQIKSLMAGYKARLSRQQPAQKPRQLKDVLSKGAPVLPPGMKQYFLPVNAAGEEGDVLFYHPQLAGVAHVNYQSARYKINGERDYFFVTEFEDGPVAVQWDNAEPLDFSIEDLEKKALDDIEFGELPKHASQPKRYTGWERKYKSWIRTDCPITIYKSPSLKLFSQPEESEGDFRARLQVLAHEKRDIEIGKLRKRYDSKLTTLENRMLRAQQKVDVQEDQARSSKIDTAISVGTAILGAFLGRKRVSSTSASRVGSAIRKAGRMRQESADVARAQELVASVKLEIEELTLAFEDDVARIEESFDAQLETLEEVSVRTKSTDIQIQLVGLLWVPYIRQPGGGTQPAFL